MVEIYQRFPDDAHCITTVINNALEADEAELIDSVYRYLLSIRRRNLIKDCLHFRKNKLLDIAKKYDQSI